MLTSSLQASTFYTLSRLEMVVIELHMRISSQSRFSPPLTVCRFSKYNLAEACKLARQGNCLEGIPDGPEAWLVVH